jgi:methylmalonyl-CoA/ethylmalonyl-CoA epimerase
MPSGVTDAELAQGPVLLALSAYTRARQPSCSTSASNAANVSRRVRSRAPFFLNSRQARQKPGILLTSPEKDHICIAVNDVKKAEKDYTDAFGWEVAYRYVDEPEKIRVTGFMVGPTAIEIMEDLDGTGEVAKFIRRAGEGVMLISYNVDNCEKSLELLKRNKVRLIDQKPRFFAEYKRNFAFIHPAATHGILTEIIDGKY